MRFEAGVGGGESTFADAHDIAERLRSQVRLPAVGEQIGELSW